MKLLDMYKQANSERYRRRITTEDCVRCKKSPAGISASLWVVSEGDDSRPVCAECKSSYLRGEWRCREVS